MITTLLPNFQNSFIAGPAFAGKTRLMFEEVTCLMLHHFNPSIKVFDRYPVAPPPGLHIIVIDAELDDDKMLELFRATVNGHEFRHEDRAVEDYLAERLIWITLEDDFRFNSPTDRGHGQDVLIDFIKKIRLEYAVAGHPREDFRLLVYVDSLTRVGDPGIGKDIEQFQEVERQLLAIQTATDSRIAWRILTHTNAGGEIMGGAALKGWGRSNVILKKATTLAHGHAVLTGTASDHDSGTTPVEVTMLTQTDGNRVTSIRFTDQPVRPRRPARQDPEPELEPQPRRRRGPTGRMTVVTPKPSKVDVIRERIVDVLTQSRRLLDREAIRTAVGISHRALDDHLDELIRTKRIRKHGKTGTRQTFGPPERYPIRVET